ncbi:hypothetical protein SPI_07294 [Niveomyces insectorum RCEF 264]|uniref:Uncharacterized protein n=1 Tax=Niveomyces insectorum RCEF 264 TaxID=1081102 RepID=A0A167QH05_9HYPO|nr:hypothetical protein SPI_07294 [Niveomyces insectorum RCEF 264]
MEMNLAEGSSSTEALLQEAPTTTMASSTSVDDENARQPQTRINPLQKWRQWRQRQADRQHADAIAASTPPRIGDTPTTIEDATSAFLYAIHNASSAALGSAYTAKCRGYEAGAASVEARAAIAIATATAAYAVADAQDRKSPSPERTDLLTTTADRATLSAEAAYAAANARGTMSLSLTSIVGLFVSPFKSPPPEGIVPYCSMNYLVASITTAAVTSAAAVQCAVEAAVTTNKTTTVKATGVQVPYDAEDAARLYFAGRLARASASAASAAASAVRLTHPILSARAARAAGTAMAASSKATATRLTILAAFSQILNPSSLNRDPERMREWIAKLESFRSTTARFEYEESVRAATPYEVLDVALSTMNSVSSIGYKIRNGELTVAAADSASAPDISDESSSVTLGASTPRTDDEDMDNSNNYYV